MLNEAENPGALAGATGATFQIRKDQGQGATALVRRQDSPSQEGRE